MKRVILTLSLLFIGCNDSSTNIGTTPPIQDGNSSEVNSTNNDMPPSPPAKYFEDDNNVEQNSSLSFVSNEVIFGGENFKRDTNFVNGEFSLIPYPESVTKEIFQLSLEIEKVEDSNKTIILRVNEIGSSRIAVVIFPNIEFKESGEIDGSNSQNIFFYGVRGNGNAVLTELDLKKIGVEANSMIYSQNGVLTIELYKSVDKVVEALGADLSMESYIVSGAEIELIVGFTNTDYLLEGVEVSNDLKDSFGGDIQSSLERKITSNTTYGFKGLITIE